MKRMQKRGLSPVITTVLLIAIAVVLAMIILLWALSWITQAVKKDGRPIAKVCDEVRFTANYAGGKIYVMNRGDINIHSFNVELKGGGRKEVENSGTLNLGKAGSSNFDLNIGTATELIITPVLEGKQGEKSATYPCDDCIGCKVEIEI